MPSTEISARSFRIGRLAAISLSRLEITQARLKSDKSLKGEPPMAIKVSSKRACYKARPCHGADSDSGHRPHQI